MDEPQTPVQYERAALRKLPDALERARTKLTAVQRRYKTDFDVKVQFCPVVEVGDLVHVDRPRRPLTSSEPGDLPKEGGGPSVKLLPKTEGPFRIRAAMPTTVVVDQVGVCSRVSMDRVTRMPRVSRTEGDEVGSPSAELARSEGALVGCRETTRKGPVRGRARSAVEIVREKRMGVEPRWGGAVRTAVARREGGRRDDARGRGRWESGRRWLARYRRRTGTDARLRLRSRNPGCRPKAS